MFKKMLIRISAWWLLRSICYSKIEKREKAIRKLAEIGKPVFWLVVSNKKIGEYYKIRILEEMRPDIVSCCVQALAGTDKDMQEIISWIIVKQLNDNRRSPFPENTIGLLISAYGEGDECAKKAICLTFYRANVQNALRCVDSFKFSDDSVKQEIAKRVLELYKSEK